MPSLEGFCKVAAAKIIRIVSRILMIIVVSIILMIIRPSLRHLDDTYDSDDSDTFDDCDDSVVPQGMSHPTDQPVALITDTGHVRNRRHA